MKALGEINVLCPASSCKWNTVTQVQERCLPGAEAVSKSAAHPATVSMSVAEGKGPNLLLWCGQGAEAGCCPGGDLHAAE